MLSSYIYLWSESDKSEEHIMLCFLLFFKELKSLIGDHKNHYFSPLKGREKHKKSARFHNILSLKAILAWSLNYLTKQQKIEIFWSNEKETILTERKTMLQQLFKVM